MSTEAQVQRVIQNGPIKTFKENVDYKTEKDKECVSPDAYQQLNTESYPFKRIIDLLLGSIAFLGLFALTPLIIVGIKLSSRGPVLFKQPRMGEEGRSFDCYKFRTMHVLERTSTDEKPIVTEKGDSRIFPFGQFLRKTNLDELPQLINVLKGEMSLVGPRPYTLKECAYWHQKFDDHYFRYMLKPGITGFAQAEGYRGGTLDDDLMRKRLDFDLIYVEKTSLKLDISIIYKTVKRMLVSNTNGH